MNHTVAKLLQTQISPSVVGMWFPIGFFSTADEAPEDFMPFLPSHPGSKRNKQRTRNDLHLSGQ